MQHGVSLVPLGAGLVIIAQGMEPIPFLAMAGGAAMAIVPDTSGGLYASSLGGVDAQDHAVTAYRAGQLVALVSVIPFDLVIQGVSEDRGHITVSVEVHGKLVVDDNLELVLEAAYRSLLGSARVNNPWFYHIKVTNKRAGQGASELVAKALFRGPLAGLRDKPLLSLPLVGAVEGGITWAVLEWLASTNHLPLGPPGFAIVVGIGFLAAFVIHLSSGVFRPGQGSTREPKALLLAALTATLTSVLPAYVAIVLGSSPMISLLAAILPHTLSGLGLGLNLRVPSLVYGMVYSLYIRYGADLIIRITKHRAREEAAETLVQAMQDKLAQGAKVSADVEKPAGFEEWGDLGYNPLIALTDSDVLKVFYEIILRRYDVSTITNIYDLGETPEFLMHQGKSLTVEAFVVEMMRFLVERIDLNPYEVTAAFHKHLGKSMTAPPELRSIFEAYMAIKAEYFDLNLIKDLLPPGGTVADIGAGSGQLAEQIMRYSDQHGLNIQNVLLTDITDWTTIGHDDERLVFVQQSSSTHFNIEANSADLVIIKWAMHHMDPESQETIIANVRRILKPGGRLVIYEPLTAGHDRKDIVDAFNDELRRPDYWFIGEPWYSLDRDLSHEFLALSVHQQQMVHALEDYFGHWLGMQRVFMPLPFTYQEVGVIEGVCTRLGYELNRKESRVLGMAPNMRMGPPSIRYVFQKPLEAEAIDARRDALEFKREIQSQSPVVTSKPSWLEIVLLPGVSFGAWLLARILGVPVYLYGKGIMKRAYFDDRGLKNWQKTLIRVASPTFRMMVGLCLILFAIQLPFQGLVLPLAVVGMIHVIVAMLEFGIAIAVYRIQTNLNRSSILENISPHDTSAAVQTLAPRLVDITLPVHWKNLLNLRQTISDLIALYKSPPFRARDVGVVRGIMSAWRSNIGQADIASIGCCTT